MSESCSEDASSGKKPSIKGKHRSSRKQERQTPKPVSNYHMAEARGSSVDNPSVVAVNISKRYVISSSGTSEDADVRRGGRNARYVDALKPMSMVVTEGESVGFIGLNGSGKSTLCNLIAGSQAPTTGKVYTKSEPTLMGVGAALQSNLTGEQNIILGLLALGMRRREAQTLVPEIADWVDIGDGITRPLSTYSSGMAARLKFAISTAVEPDILLVDEALATGDVSFTAKAEKRMQDTLARAGNLFLVSHSLKQVEKNCTRAVWLHKGEVIMDGKIDDIGPLYHEWARLRSVKDNPKSDAFLQECRDAYVPPVIYLQDADESNSRRRIEMELTDARRSMNYR